MIDPRRLRQACQGLSVAVLLALFITPSVATPSFGLEKRDGVISTNLPVNWTYVGCYTDDPNSPTLSAASYQNTTSMTQESCILFCAARGFIEAGLEYSYQCFCGDDDISSRKATGSDCAMTCSGNSTESCGSGYRLNIFHSNQTSRAPTTNPGVNNGTGNWNLYGCYTEGNGGRALTTGIDVPGGQNNMTVANCVDSCGSLGFLLAGVEYAYQCYCGNEFSNSAGPATDGYKGCQTPCSGNATELCGGGNYLDVYGYKNIVPNPLNPPTSTSSTVTSTTTKSSSMVSSSSSNQLTTSSSYSASTTSPGSSSSLSSSGSGSTSSHTSAGTTSSSISSSSTSSLTSSSDSDSGATDSYSSTGTTSSSTSSSSTSSSIFSSASDSAATSSYSSTGTTSSSISSSSTSNLVSPLDSDSAATSSYSSIGTTSSSTSSRSATSSSTTSANLAAATPQWYYAGCYTDNNRPRTLNYQITGNANIMTNELCYTQCKAQGYLVSGTEYYSECYCDISINNGGTLTAASDCNTACNGNSSETCGGGNRLTVFIFGYPGQGPLSSTSSSVRSTSATSTSSAAAPSSSTGWNYQGCYVDSVGARTLGYAITGYGSTMTNELCQSQCLAAGYTLAGTEYSGECYCDIALRNGGGPAPDGSTYCNSACYGNTAETCGGSNRLTLFSYKAPVVSVTTTTSSSTTSTAPTALSSSGWLNIGCYNDTVGRRTLNYQQYGNANSMTNKLCQSECKAAGYVIAGTEYAGECYCDNVFENYGQPATDGCTTACSGDATDTCGGNNRLNVYSYVIVSSVTTSTTPSSSSSSSSSGSIHGTMSTSTIVAGTSSSSSSSISSSSSSATSSSSRSSSGTSSSTTSPITSSSSSAGSSGTTSSTGSSSTTSSSRSSSGTSSSSASSSSSSGTSGTSSSTASSSSSTSGSSSSPSATSSSSRSSSATSSSTTSSSTTSSFTTSSSTTSSSAAASSAAGWTYIGCYSDSVGSRTLANTFDVPGGANYLTNEACQAVCLSNNFKYAGTEYSTQCFCDNAFENGGGPASDGEAQCTMTCNGNTTEICGGSNRLSVYAYHAGTPSSVSTTIPSAPPSTTSSTPLATPSGWNYTGCWIDGANGRILTYQQNDNPQLTIESCITTCSGLGYTVAGMEYGEQCFCDDFIRNGAAKTAETDCSMTCAGNTKEFCGNGGRMNVYSKGPLQVYVPPAVQNTSLPGNWTYTGCLTDNADSRSLKYRIINMITNNTATNCLSLCSEFGYPAGGTEYSTECYCGDFSDVVNAGATIRPDSECNMACSGNASTICGGPSRISYYSWTGADLYDWARPTGNAAGEYEFLIGGVTIPLITTQTITGKITYLEKFGTSPANNGTGAYELDLAQISNFTGAWRPMHVKTDVFCSAGLTLPDKAGRQLNVGGWANEATYGIRLYWPDGKPGVWGTNDWQENVNEELMQNGRWYPSAMIMANGSILIMGGEEGSNGAPVPTLEVLPYAGPYQYCDYLARTDPYNLYPYLAVLPTGGIFVAYYNEARILNEVTLNTDRTLPNIPAAVNDFDGGRTYPFEGTSVLLPQHAPYGDPLQIMICGGSTPGPEIAIDNCVSIAPETPGANWTIERMPSSRVISCMTALPDGTYLIMNGGQQGRAGFGLATDPNLNAVLYDPSKPVNHRMSVMANTTVARLYHSEAILLQDGRVLVSGSDPEDLRFPQEYRNEVFLPPYLLSGAVQPTISVPNTDWSYGVGYTVQILSSSTSSYRVSLMGAESSTHGNSMGQRTIFPAVSCSGGSCTVTAPPNAHVCPPGWYQLFLLDGPTPSHSVYVRIGGDPARLGFWPNFPDFQPLPGPTIGA